MLKIICGAIAVINCYNYSDLFTDAIIIFTLGFVMMLWGYADIKKKLKEKSV